MNEQLNEAIKDNKNINQNTNKRYSKKNLIFVFVFIFSFSLFGGFSNKPVSSAVLSMPVSNISPGKTTAKQSLVLADTLAQTSTKFSIGDRVKTTIFVEARSCAVFFVGLLRGLK